LKERNEVGWDTQYGEIGYNIHGRRHGFLGGGTKQDSRAERAEIFFCTPTFPNVGVQASKYQ